MWRLPLWTAKVRPTKSGVMVERRDQVLIAGGRLAPPRISSTFFSKCRSMNGPFLTERAIALSIFDLRFLIFDLSARKRLLLPIANQKSKIKNYFTLRSRTIIFDVRLVLRVL